MKTVKTWQAWLVILVIPMLGGCFATMGHVTQTMSDKKFLKASDSERSEYLSVISSEEATLIGKKQAEYKAGRPVHYEDPETGLFRTIQWDKMLDMIYIYPGKTTDMLTMNTHGVVAAEADANGKVKYHPDGRGGMRPNIFLVNVAVEEGEGRMLFRGATQILSAGFNSYWAAQENCGNNCGNINLHNGASSQSLAETVTNSTLEAGINTCSSGGCPE